MRTNEQIPDADVCSFAETLPPRSPDERVCSFVRRGPAPTNNPNAPTLSTPSTCPDHRPTTHADGHAIGEWLRQDFAQRCLEAGLAIRVARTVRFGWHRGGFAITNGLSQVAPCCFEEFDAHCVSNSPSTSSAGIAFIVPA
jgi:hypothetical protein